MKKRKALTLIEVLLSMAIIGIVAVLVITIYGFSLKNITKSDKRTKNILGLEDEVKGKILDNEGEEKTIEIDFGIPNIEKKLIEGRVITTDEEDKKSGITTFIPSKNQD